MMFIPPSVFDWQMSNDCLSVEQVDGKWNACDSCAAPAARNLHRVHGEWEERHGASLVDAGRRHLTVSLSVCDLSVSLSTSVALVKVTTAVLPTTLSQNSGCNFNIAVNVNNVVILFLSLLWLWLWLFFLGCRQEAWSRSWHPKNVAGISAVARPKACNPWIYASAKSVSHLS